MDFRRYSFDSDDSSVVGDRFKTEPERKAWDAFNDPPVQILTGSMKESKYLEALIKIFKFLTYIVTFLVVLGASTISKGTLLFMTSQIESNVSKPYCNELIDRNKQFEVTLPATERLSWIWIIIFTYFIPEIITFFKSIRVCLFKTWKRPPASEWISLFATESFPPIGNALMVFGILPKLDVIKGVMLTNAVCLVPAIIGTISRTPHERNSVFKLSLDVISILAQLSALLVWPMIENDPVMWLIPISVLLISVGWWENFVCEGSPLKVLKRLGKQKKKLENSRYFLYIFVSLWKCILFFVTTIIVILIKEGSVGFMFEDFIDAFRSHTINVTEIKPIIGDQVEYGTSNTTFDTIVTADNLTPVWVFLINIFSTYLCYVFAKFACKISIQSFSFAFPLNLTVPTAIAILVALCGVHNGNPCAFNSIPAYLFFKSPSLYFLEEFITTEHVWIWVLWLLSQTWITIHIWSPQCERLAKTERLFIKPMYDSFFIDQSLILNRRRDDSPEKIEDEDDDNYSKIKPSNDFTTTRIYICGTMWHEKEEEMSEFLKSIFRLDEDHACRQLAKKLQPGFKDYYELENHIFFDDAFVRKDALDENPKVNDYVLLLVAAIEDAARKVHECDLKLRPPTKYNTPYGGRLVWILPGETRLIAHLKDSKKVRQKKRWSQVMYMYYLLGHKLMERGDLTSRQKDILSENTYLLALDGDIDFQPKDVHLLVDLMKKNKGLGAACGRLHPLGSGPLVWYQMFEYAIGHWLQKATEHVIGCVLCSPGCFSLFRAKALMEDGVMRRYASKATQARHYVQYDLGEDRWLCTLLLQNGYRIEYSAASDAHTHCPEGFNEFYSQRRRWMPSTTANIMDLLFHYERTVKVNDNISRPYILYQIVLLIGTVLGPGTIFLMLVGAFVAVFQMDQWTAFLWNAVPILIFMAACILFKDDVQLLFAGVISAVYGLVMMAVLIGVMLQISQDGILAPSSLFFFCFAGELILTGFFHPKELNCLLYGLVYYVTVPSMYMLLVIYAVFNLNNISWGTRELTLVKNEEEEKLAEKTEEKPNQKLKSFNLFGDSKDDNGGGFEFSIAGLFKCFFCTHSKTSKEQEKLIQISSNLKEITDKLNMLEKTIYFNGKHISNKSTSLSSEKPTVIEGSKGTPQEIGVDSDKNSLRSDQNTWVDVKSLGSGAYGNLEQNEIIFFQDLINKYLHRIERNDAQVDKDLKDLRDKTVMAFFMINALFVLVIFLLTLKKDLLHVSWPLGAKYNFTYYDDRREIYLYKTPLELEPIGFVFLIFFASLLVVQFIAMLFHRFSTFSHILANTHINPKPWLKRNKDALDVEKLLEKDPVKQIKKFTKLKGADDENEDQKQETTVGRRKTVKYLAEQTKQPRQSTNNLYEAFDKRTTRYAKNENSQNAAKKSMANVMYKRKSMFEKRSSVKVTFANGYDNDGFENFPSN